MSRWGELALSIIAEADRSLAPWRPAETVEIAETMESDPGAGVSTVSTVSTWAIAADIAERAAIVQEGAQVPRDWAEGFALLEARPLPSGVNAATWLAMIDAAGRFLDQWGSQAAALGWTASQLFGLDADCPINRRDRRGAAFFLIGAEVLALTADAITIRMGGNIQHVYRRSGSMAPAWTGEGAA